MVNGHHPCSSQGYTIITTKVAGRSHHRTAPCRRTRKKKNTITPSFCFYFYFLFSLYPLERTLKKQHVCSSSTSTTSVYKCTTCNHSNGPWDDTFFLLIGHFIIIGRFVTLHYNISNFYRKSKKLLGFPSIFTGKSAIRFSTHLKKKKSQELPARYYYIHTFHQ